MAVFISAIIALSYLFGYLHCAELFICAIVCSWDSIGPGFNARYACANVIGITDYYSFIAVISCVDFRLTTPRYPVFVWPSRAGQPHSTAVGRADITTQSPPEPVKCLHYDIFVFQFCTSIHRPPVPAQPSRRRRHCTVFAADRPTADVLAVAEDQLIAAALAITAVCI